MSPYWQEQMSPWTRASQNISEQLMRLPAMRAMGQQRAAMGQYYQAHAGQEDAAAEEALARTRLLTAQSVDAESGNASQDRLSAALKKVVTNPNDTDAAGDAISEFGHYFKKNPDAAAKGVGDLMSRIMAMRGDTNFATQGSLQGGAASIANNQANNARIASTPRVVAPNASLVDPETGQPIALGNALLHPGETLTPPDAETMTYPTQAGASGTPIPPKPSPADLQRPVLLRELIKGGTSLDSSISGTNAPAGLKLYDALVKAGAPAAANAPTNATESAGSDGDNGPFAGPTNPNGPAVPIQGAMVRVRHPNGQTGLMPAANLPAALKMGYTQVQ